MFPDGWFDDYNLKFHLPIESYGRLGHCVTTYDGNFSFFLPIFFFFIAVQLFRYFFFFFNCYFLIFFLKKGTYAICDASIPMKEIKKIKEPPKLTRKEPAVSSFDGRGAFTIVDTEYR